MDGPVDGSAPNNEREKRLDDCLRGMHDAAQRMKEDLAKAPRKKYPRQYANSAINDAEVVIRDQQSKAEQHLKRIEHGPGATPDTKSPVERLDGAEAACATLVMQARERTEELWPVPMD